MSSPISVPNLSYMDKAYNLYQDYKLEKFPQNGAARTNKMLRNAFGEDFPDALEIIRKSSFVFINIPEILDQVKPISNKIVHIGGIALKEPKKLDERLAKIFENSQKGVVLFSFGSFANTDLMPEAIKMAYLEAFSTFPQYEFIWKYHLRKNDTLLFSKYPNVHPMEWVDQSSILAQRKTKAFMTHCGLNSFIEGSFNGIPMIATPLFADQNYNAAIIEHKGTGIYLDLKKVTTMTVTNALKEILESDRYYKNAQELKKKLTTFPYKSNEKIVKFVEYAAENLIEDELNLPGANMTFIEYFCLDILIPLFVLALLFTYVVYRILYRLITFTLYSVVKTKAD
uniref:glucuronosyltransferase n=1 Tax=Acrobeloides nanus TaxID=290746 RepID=A0A914E457_9BILA